MYADHGQKLVAVVRGTPLAGCRRFHCGRVELVFAEQVVERRPFPQNGGEPQPGFSSTGNNQRLWRGLLKSEDTPCPKSGHVPNQDTCPESGLAGAHDMPGQRRAAQRADVVARWWLSFEPRIEQRQPLVVG